MASNLLRRVIMFLILVVVLYLLVWMLVYSIIIGFDYSHITDYFVLGWRGGGELPAAIQMLTFLAMAILALVVLGLRWCRARAGKGSRKSC